MRFVLANEMPIENPSAAIETAVWAIIILFPVMILFLVWLALRLYYQYIVPQPRRRTYRDERENTP